jgi:hypothetical protein
MEVLDILHFRDYAMITKNDKKEDFPMKKKTFGRSAAAVLAAVILISAMPGAAASTAITIAPTFSDVPTTHWAYDSIQYCYSNGLVKGVTETTFSPSSDLTGTQFIVLLGRCAFEEDVEAATTATDTWSSAYIRVAKEKGVLDGVTYVENAPITRYEMAQLIYNTAIAAGQKANGTYGDCTDFSDCVDLGTFPNRTAVSWCYGTGILNGIDGAYKGDGTMTRAQAATVIYRFNQFLDEHKEAIEEKEPENAEIPATNEDAGVWAGSVIANDPPHEETFVSTETGDTRTYVVSGDYKSYGVYFSDMSTLDLCVYFELGDAYADKSATVTFYLADGTKISSYTKATDEDGRLTSPDRDSFRVVGRNFRTAYENGENIFYAVVDCGGDSIKSELFGSNAAFGTTLKLYLLDDGCLVPFWARYQHQHT